MDLHIPEDVPDTPEQRAADRRRLLLAFNLNLVAVLLLAIVHFLTRDMDVRPFTVTPHDPAGLLGVLTAPLLHGSAEHLGANAVSLLLLGSLAAIVYPRATLRALPLMWLGSGLAAWLLGEPGSHHLGASGVTHGLMFLIFVLGLLRRDRPSVAAGMIAFFLYGGMLLTVLPHEPGVSWQSHLGGAIGGVLGAFLFRWRDPLPPRRRYSWELEDDDTYPDEALELEPPPPQTVPVLWNRPVEQRGVVLQFPPRSPRPGDTDAIGDEGDDARTPGSPPRTHE